MRFTFSLIAVSKTIFTSALVFFLVMLGMPASVARAETIPLATCSGQDLINAIVQANATVEHDIIALKAGCTGANAYTLQIVNNTDATTGANGLPVITQDLTISGANSEIVRATTNGIANFRLFQVAADASLELVAVTLKQGRTSGASSMSANGGAIYNKGTLNLSAVSLDSNSANESGGAIFNDINSVATLTDATLRSNTAVGNGGGLYAATGTLATINHSTFDSNNGKFGGGIASEGSVNVQRSTFNKNVALAAGGIAILSGGTLNIAATTFSENNGGTAGGAIATSKQTTTNINSSTFVKNQLNAGGVGAGLTSDGGVIIANSTFTENGGDNVNGGGIYSNGNVALINVTIANNRGYGILNVKTLTLRNTIVAGNKPDNCFNDLTDGGHNLDSGTTCGFTQRTSLNKTNPKLKALADNGGPTQTMALEPNSPAQDGGSNGVCKAQPVGALDQRNVHRPQGTDCDMGAFELQEITAPCTLPQTAPVLVAPKDKEISSTRIVSFDWESVECAPKYQVRYARSNQSFLTEQTPVSHFTTPELENGATYNWQVRACRKRLCGDWSELRTFTVNQ